MYRNETQDTAWLMDQPSLGVQPSELAQTASHWEAINKMVGVDKG